MDLYRFSPGDTPVLISIPHAGLHVPADIAARLSPDAEALPDTDWHVERLYDFASGMGAGVLAATHSRYVVDLNRDPAGADLYPGADNTEVCPTSTFDRAPLYQAGDKPDEAEIESRLDAYWRPYHDKIATELAALKSRFGLALLFDAHSIRSQVPRFFAGRLPDLNFGTASGASASRDLSDRLYAVLQGGEGYTSVRDGRFTGGYITRTYGAPEAGVHAVQLELAQCTYMDEHAPYSYLPDLADKLRPVLRALVGEMIGWSVGQAATAKSS